MIIIAASWTASDRKIAASDGALEPFRRGIRSLPTCLASHRPAVLVVSLALRP